MRITMNFVMYLFLWVGSTAFLWINQGFTGWFLFLSITSVLAYIIVNPLFILHDVHVKRTIQAPTFAHGEALFTIQIQHRSILPIYWMVVKEQWKVQDKLISRTMLAFPLKKKKQIEVQYKFSDVQRGKYILQQTEILSGDIFGFIRKRKRVISNDTFVVYPYPQTKEIIANAQNGFLSQTKESLSHLNIEWSGETRNYTPGDPLNRIHWKQSARTSEIKIRKTEALKAQKMIVMIDTKLDDSSDREILETMLEVVSGLFQLAIKKKIPTGLLSTDTKHEYIPIRVSSLFHEGYLALSEMEPQGKLESKGLNLDLSDLIAKYEKQVVGETALVIVTAALNTAFMESIQSIISSEKIEFNRKTIEIIHVMEKDVPSKSQRQYWNQLKKMDVSVLPIPKTLIQKREGGRKNEVQSAS